MENTMKEMIIAPITGQIISETTLGLDVPEFIEAEEVFENTNHPNFIESNTQATTLDALKDQCIVPTFSDNTLTIAHQNFIDVVYKAAERVYGELTPIECRVSHPIIGRVPNALHKNVKDLREDEKTLFYQRLAWCCQVKNLTREINGQSVHLCIGGVRAYNEDKLYAKKAPEKFKIFVGWRVRVCSNLCLTCDGYSGTVECMSTLDLFEKACQLFTQFVSKKEDNLVLLENLGRTKITENQFCQIIGRLRLYQALPTIERKGLPEFDLGDNAVNAATRNYITNPNFGKKSGDMSCWNLMQLLNEAAKLSYIDTWLSRNQNCTNFAIGIQKALEGNDTEGYTWFLN